MCVCCARVDDDSPLPWQCRCAFETGVASKGASIANCGLATTPAMFFSCVATGHQYDGGVMATASHLPFNRNGLKFFTKHGGALSALMV